MKMQFRVLIGVVIVSWGAWCWAAPVPYSTEVIADTPAIYWRLGETSGTVAADSSGNNRNGTNGGEIRVRGLN